MPFHSIKTNACESLFLCKQSEKYEDKKLFSFKHAVCLNIYRIIQLDASHAKNKHQEKNIEMCT
jgi:hypothetical protein